MHDVCFQGLQPGKPRQETSKGLSPVWSYEKLPYGLVFRAPNRLVISQTPAEALAAYALLPTMDPFRCRIEEMVATSSVSVHLMSLFISLHTDVFLPLLPVYILVATTICECLEL